MTPHLSPQPFKSTHFFALALCINRSLWLGFSIRTISMTQPLRVSNIFRTNPSAGDHIFSINLINLDQVAQLHIFFFSLCLRLTITLFWLGILNSVYEAQKTCGVLRTERCAQGFTHRAYMGAASYLSWVSGTSYQDHTSCKGSSKSWSL